MNSISIYQCRALGISDEVSPFQFVYLIYAETLERYHLTTHEQRVYISTYYAICRRKGTSQGKQKISTIQKNEHQKLISRELLRMETPISAAVGGVGYLAHRFLSLDGSGSSSCFVIFFSAVFGEQRLALEVPFFHSALCCHSKFSNERNDVVIVCRQNSDGEHRLKQVGSRQQQFLKTPFLFLRGKPLNFFEKRFPACVTSNHSS